MKYSTLKLAISSMNRPESSRLLGQDVTNDVSVHVRQAKVSTAMPIIQSSSSNIMANPAFTAANDGHILSSSPNIDRGADPALYVSTLVDSDMDGELRPTDGDSGGTAEWDIGADEYIP